MQQTMRTHLHTQVYISHRLAALELGVEGMSKLQHHTRAVAPKGSLATGPQLSLMIVDSEATVTA